MHTLHHWIAVNEARQAAKFILQPKLNPKNYVMTNSLGDADRWKAMTYEANSGGDVGKMDAVGYVMISLTDNTIIPIARGDEHHVGYDVLDRLARKLKFKSNDYVSISATGSNYLFDKREIPKFLKVAEKYLAYGGLDGALVGANDYDGSIVTLSHFVQSKGKMLVAPKELAPVGKVVLDAFRAVAEATEAARTSPQRSVHGRAFQVASACLRLLNNYFFVLRDLNYEQLEKAVAALPQMKAEDDIDGLQQMFFGFHGIKNELHNRLRAVRARFAAGKPDIFDDKRQAAWGDVDQAIEMLGRL